MKYLSYVLSIKLLLFTALLIFIPIGAFAQSESLVVMQVQTASPASASEEIIVIFNYSDNEVKVTEWCLNYSSSSDITKRKLACIEASEVNTDLYLESKGIVTFSSGEFVLSNPGFVPDFVFTAGMANSGGHVWITDENDEIVDRVGWGPASAPEKVATLPHLPGETISRNYLEIFEDTDDNSADFMSLPLINPLVSGLYEVEAVIDICTNIPELQTEIPEGYLLDENGLCQEDFCPNIDGLQVNAPAGYEKKLGTNLCIEIPLEDSILFITELLPNAPSTDNGKEFIELYNPNSETIELSGYKIEVGPLFSKQFEITSGVIEPEEYIVFSDLETNIVLPNTNGVELRLLAPNGDVVSKSPVYSNASDDVSWALVENQWIYTNQITPGSANKPYLEPAQDEILGVTTVYAPCPAGKFRNPVTNRCKNIESAIVSLTPCDEDEYRNPETNRCRKITSTTSSLTPCKPGQERNPETNRCRKIESSDSLKPCPEGQERNPETNRCRKVSVLGVSTDDIPTITDVEVENTQGQLNWPIILITLLGTFGYIIYEWRSEIGHNISRAKLQYKNR